MKRITCTILVVLLLLGSLAGCGKSVSPPENPTNNVEEKPSDSALTQKPAEQPAEDITEEPEEPVTEEPEEPITEEPITEEPVTEEPAEVQTPEAAEPAAPGNASELLEGLVLEDAAIVIDGVLYKSEDPYSLFVENGWDFDFDDYNIGDDYVLNKGEYVYATIKLNNPEKYGDGYSNPSITIGIINNGEKVMPLKECSIHGIKVSGTSGFSRYEDKQYGASPCYDFEIIKGLCRGASMEAVKAAWGEPDDVYIADGDNYHYEIFTYEGDHVTYKLTVYTNPDIGLQDVEINDSRNWKR